MSYNNLTKLHDIIRDMDKKFKPKTLKGFRDYFAEDVFVRDKIRNTFKNIVEKYAYEKLETPSLEYSELILGQSGDEAEKLYYRFKDNGDRDVMLKYELMISMCRAIAQNFNNIAIPYKRYQIQNAWRAENVQRGRLREFTQMDIDIVGSSSQLADAEVIEIGIRFLESLGLQNFTAKISNRKVLKGIIEYLNIPQELFDGFYTSVDKLQKIGEEKIIEELKNIRGIDPRKVDEIIRFLKVKELKDLENTVGTTTIGKEGIDELKQILQILSLTDISSDKYIFDITLARGLASYTGPIWEFEILDGGVGSLGGGGRYDKAISKYLGQEIPATGTSFGLERLQEILVQNNIIKRYKDFADLLIIPIDADSISYSMKVAQKFRKSNIKTMIYPDKKKFGTIFNYAEKQDIKWVAVIGPDEEKENMIQLKNIDSKEQEKLSIDQAISKISSK